jgi:hypothetical protein
MLAQGAPHGGRAIRVLQSTLTIMGLKAGEHDLAKGDAPLQHMSRILGKEITPRDNSCDAHAGTLAHMRMCANGHAHAAQEEPHGE